MATDPIPWMVQGGLHSSSLGRIVAYQSVGGAEGIAGLGDLLVRQQTVAAGSVRIAAGAAIMTNRYPGVKNESYVGRNVSETTVTVASNGSGSTRHDMVIARIDDWNFPGAQAVPAPLPTDTAPAFKLGIVSGVSASAKTAKELALNYPAIALARVSLPAATSAVTTAMITDLREVAVPRRKRDVRALNQKSGRNNPLTVTATTGEQFPNDGIFTVEIPDWATKVVAIETLGGIYCPVGTVYGAIWARIGHGRADVINVEASLIDLTSSARNDPSRVTAVNGVTVSIPSTMRGQSVTCLLMGRKLGGTANLLADAATSMILDLEFLEAPTEDV